MRIQRIICASLAFAICLLTSSAKSAAPSAQRYQNTTQPQRPDSRAARARRLARQMSGRDYEFTAACGARILKAVDFYARRIGNNGGDKLGRGEARFTFE